MKTGIRIIGICFLAAILMAVTLTGCTKLRAGDTFTATTDGVEFQYEVIVSRMNYVRVIPASGRLSGNVTLPKTLAIIEASAFAGCSALETINTPQPLSQIGDYAFDGCRSLKAFSLDASISALGKGCFRGCSSLTTVVFPTSFTEIPDEAFYGCASLEEIRCPATLLKIGRDAFGGCSYVKEIYLDRSVQSIGAKAFAGCVSVASITCMTATPPACTADTFDGIPTDIPVTVMMSSVDSYRNTAGWNRFWNYLGKY